MTDLESVADQKRDRQVRGVVSNAICVKVGFVNVSRSA